MANMKGVLISGPRTFSHREEKLADNSPDATLTDMTKVDGRCQTLTGSHRKYQAPTDNVSHPKVGLKVRTPCSSKIKQAALHFCGITRHMTRKKPN